MTTITITNEQNVVRTFPLSFQRYYFLKLHHIFKMLVYFATQNTSKWTIQKSLSEESFQPGQISGFIERNPAVELVRF